MDDQLNKPDSEIPASEAPAAAAWYQCKVPRKVAVPVIAGTILLASAYAWASLAIHAEFLSTPCTPAPKKDYFRSVAAFTDGTSDTGDSATSTGADGSATKSQAASVRKSPTKIKHGFDISTSLIPVDEIRSGGPRKDGIPALTNPKVVAANAAKFLKDRERVIGVEFNGEARAYPLSILNYHEAANDTIGGRAIVATYCPLCDSALVFDREVNGQIREFGISGLLWNSNVLLYDRQAKSGDESLWSQVLMKAVTGIAAKDSLELSLVPSSLISWGEWKKQHPNTTVLSNNTGHSRDYNRNPYIKYFTDHQLVFPVNSPEENKNEDLRVKERVAIVKVGELMKIYPYSRLEAAAGEGKIVTDNFNGAELKLTINNYFQKSITVEVADSGDADVSTAYSFWFAVAAMQPNAEIFE